MTSTPLPSGDFKKNLITSALLNPPRWDDHASENKKGPSRFHYLGLKIKALSQGQGMWCRYVNVNNSAWSKSSSEGDRYFYVLCFIWDRKMAPVYIIWIKPGAGGNACSRYVRLKEKGSRKQENRLALISDGKSSITRGTSRLVGKLEEDRVRLIKKVDLCCWDERRGCKNDDALERKEDDTNGFWTRCIQLLQKAWIKHCPGQSSRTSYGALH